MFLGKEHDRAVTSAVAVILLVAVAVILGATITVYFFGFTEKIGGPTAEATFEYAESPVGIEMTAEQIAEDVTVEINGKQVASFDSSDAGQSRLIPTSPGDQLTVISADGSRSVLVSRTIDDRDRIGDFIAHYTFEKGDNSDILYDESGNDNTGDLKGDPKWTGGSLRFDGSDYVDVNDLSADVDVSEFTIAATFTQESTDRTQQIIEHYGGGNEWYLENDQVTANEYSPVYAIDHGAGESLEDAGSYSTGERRTLVGTYDGKTFELYIDGKKIDSANGGDDVKMGELVIGADAPGGSSQRFDGEIHEIRLYHTAFDTQGIESVSKVME